MSLDHFKYRWVLLAIICLGAFLRLYDLAHIPISLYSDEVSQAYNAYSVLKTGKDEYGTFLPVSFRSFGDWKPPAQTYLLIPSIFLFGLNDAAVRLPSALLGILTIFMVSQLVIEISPRYVTSLNEKHIRVISLLSALFLALSPVHIQQSRSAMLVNIALSFLVMGLWFFYKGLKDARYWVVSAAAWAFTIYSYYGMRVIVPLTLVYLGYQFKTQIFQKDKLKYIIFAISLAAVLLSPLIIQTVSNPDVLLGRAKTVSIFYDQGIRLRTWELIADDGGNLSPLMTQIFHNKMYTYLIDIQRRFFQHFDGRFLFMLGDEANPFPIPGQGPLYFIDGIFIALGAIFLIRKEKAFFKFLLSLIVISVVPSALTYLTPAINRPYNMIVPLMILSACGVWACVSSVRSRVKIVVLGVISIMYIISFSYFVYAYAYQLNYHYSYVWQYGFEEINRYVKEHQQNYDEVVISAKISMPYIFLMYLNQVPPEVAQKELKHNLRADNVGFEHVETFRNFRFIRDYSWDRVGERLRDALLILTPAEEVQSPAKLVYTVKYPDGKDAFYMYEVRRNE